jgi:hypothetical protein
MKDKMATRSWGFVYIAFGQQYVDEAAASARSVRALHRYPITLITDQQPAEHVSAMFDSVRVERLKRDYSDKILMGTSPYERTIFLDSDTVVLGKMDDLFSMLDRFDFGIQFTEGGNHYTLPGVPTCFYEPSAGIIAWKRSDRVQQFFADWAKAYELIEKQQGTPGAWDQRSLRLALYESDLRLAPLSAEWQFYTYKPNVVAGPVVMVHGRLLAPHVIKSIEKSTELRVWMPKVGACPGYHVASAGEMLRFTRRLAVRVSTVLVRRGLAAAGIWPLPKNQRPA